MCGEYCCIPGTQYAQHNARLISLSLALFLLCPLSCSSSTPPFCSPSPPSSLLHFFSTSPPRHSPLGTVCPSLFMPSRYLSVISFYAVSPQFVALCCYIPSLTATSCLPLFWGHFVLPFWCKPSLCSTSTHSDFEKHIRFKCNV